MNLTVFKQKNCVETLEDLRGFLGVRREGKYGAFWLSPGPEELPALGMFINADRACMFYYRFEGDSGFHTLGNEAEDFDRVDDFVIDNYQLDQYPRAIVVPASEAIAAFEEFFQTRELPKAVRWLELN